MNFDDLQTDSTYNTYKVCPEVEEIKELPFENKRVNNYNTIEELDFGNY